MPTTITIRERTGSGDAATSIMRRALEGIRSYTVGKISLKDPALAKLFGEGYQTAAGIPVTDANVYTFSAVYDAVNQSSSDLAKLPLNLKKRRKEGGSDDFEASKTFWLLKYEANPDMSAFEFRRTLQAHALTCKGAFAEIERDSNERPAALWPLTPDRVEPFIEKATLPNGRYRTRLRYRIDGERTNIIEAPDMLHIRGLGYDGYCAYPVIDKARQAIGLALAAERFASAFFGNNSNFGGLLTAEDDLDEPQRNELRAEIEKIYKGPAAAWKLLILGAGFKYQRTGITPSESQMNDLRAKQVEEVARFFNFPVHKLKNLDRATNNNIESQGIEYYTSHQLTWITNWEGELNRKLIPSLEVGQQYFKHNANATLRSDAVGRTALYTALLDRGVFCADDVLELEDRNPQPNGQGKIYLVQGAMVPKDQVVPQAKARVELIQAQVEKAKQPPPPAPAPAATDQQVQDANARAAAAEEIAHEATATAQREREARIAAEAAGTATAEQLTALRESERRALTAAADATALTIQLRADAEAARMRAAAAETARAEQEIQTLEQAGLREAAEGRATASALEHDLLAAEARAATERANEAANELLAARERVAAAETAASGATTDRAAVEEARTAAQAAFEDARLALASAEADRNAALTATAEAIAMAAAARTEADEARARVDAAARLVADAEASRASDAEQRTVSDQRRAELEQQIVTLTAEREAAAAASTAQGSRLDEFERSAVNAREQLAALTAALADVRGVNETTITALQAGVVALERDRDEARALMATLETRVTESAALVAEREAELRTVRQADADAMAAQIAAHRGLLSDIMRRMVERETDRARRAQITPEKMRRWMETFYDGHAELMRTALLPAICIHLAFIRSTEDPVEATRRLVDTHVRESERQLRNMLDGDAEALAASLPALLYRWDTERPTHIADRLMAKELNYARRL
jgi:HK97 family phage portal protein